MPEFLPGRLPADGQNGLDQKPLDLEGLDSLDRLVVVVVVVGPSGELNRSESGIEGRGEAGMAEGQQSRDGPDDRTARTDGPDDRPGSGGD